MPSEILLNILPEHVSCKRLELSLCVPVPVCLIYMESSATELISLKRKTRLSSTWKESNGYFVSIFRFVCLQLQSSKNNTRKK